MYVFDTFGYDCMSVCEAVHFIHCRYALPCIAVGCCHALHLLNTAKAGDLMLKFIFNRYSPLQF